MQTRACTTIPSLPSARNPSHKLQYCHSAATLFDCATSTLIDCATGTLIECLPRSLTKPS